MIWWYWVVLGLALAALEIATPGGFFVIFFAAAALLVGILELLGLVTRDAIQWVLLPSMAVVALSLFRRPLLERMRRRESVHTVDSLVGDIAFAVSAIPAGGYGRAELRGSIWSARNVDAAALAAGERCRVVAVRGLELDISSQP